MKFKLLLIISLLFNLQCLLAQNNFIAIIKDYETNEPLMGVSAGISGTFKQSMSDIHGRINIINIPNGKQIIELNYAGYELIKDTIVFPITDSIPLVYLLKPISDELNEVIVLSTRSTRSINNVPTRVEFIAGEELEEKANMKAGDIRMLLSESTGIQIQQTSATTGNASIRIQGLDGRYTLVLKDGFPIFAGAANGLGLLQTPPLDLKQVEIIKGSSSTLYGGSAIAGLVNLISKTPTEEKELKFHLNGSSGGGYDLYILYQQKFKKIGSTIFASNNRNWAYDPANIDLTAIPKFNRYIINPKVFIYINDRSDFNIGLNVAIEDRIGGDIHKIKGRGDNFHSYFEENNTQRYSLQSNFNYILNNQHKISIKNSLSYFDRTINIPNYTFMGMQSASFTEANYKYHSNKTEWIAGINIWTDSFNEKQLQSVPLRDYNQTTFGAFVQNTYNANKIVTIESGFRTDYVLNYGIAYLPRIATLFKINKQFTSRLSGGFGYKAPTIFTEESEKIQYQNVFAINPNINKLEKSYGANIDLNYQNSIHNKLFFSINQLLFYTKVNHPLLLKNIGNKQFQFLNSSGNLYSSGAETNIKITYENFKLFLGYTLTNARIVENQLTSNNPLTPRNKFNTVLMYEKDESLKIGLESYYFGKQKLSDGSDGKSYTLNGLMIEKLWEKFSLYINFENFLDVRQTRFDSIYYGSLSNPTFKDIYAPLDGFLINMGIKLKL